MQTKNVILCSTGAFTGKINNRDYKLGIKYSDKINCDGYEMMMFSEWYDNIENIIREYREADINCPVFHTDKRLGDYISIDGDDNFCKCKELFKRNCEIAAGFGSSKLVMHVTGKTCSDKYEEMIYRRIYDILCISEEYGMDLTVENCACTFDSPVKHMSDVARLYPKCGFTLDTRPAQFHGELEDIRYRQLVKSRNIRHVHINDYSGGYKEWGRLYPILQPGLGNIDFMKFFKMMNEENYSYSYTLEASAHIENGVDIDTLNNSIKFILDCIESDLK